MRRRASLGGTLLLLCFGSAAAQAPPIANPGRYDSRVGRRDLVAAITSSLASKNAGATPSTSTPARSSTAKDSSSLRSAANHHGTLTFTGTAHPTPHSFTFHPRPLPTEPVETPSPEPSAHHVDPVAVLFAVLGGLVGLALLVLCARCVSRYRRTPRRDRIAAIVDRVNLERELAEMEEAQPVARRASLVPPPPAYERAPDYDEVARQAAAGASDSSDSDHSRPPERPPDLRPP